jgi:hypothetical protein
VDGYIVAGIVVVIALVIFFKLIVRLIDRISGASKQGITFERPQDGAEIKPAILPFVEIMKHPISPTALEREQFIDKQLNALGLATEKEKIAAIVRVFAITRIELEFNNIAHMIFGSQINLLVHIAGTNNGATTKDAEIIFEKAQVAYPSLHGNKKFEAWLSYLITNNLVVSNAAMIDITQYGKDFLKHLIDSRQAHQRYG